MEAAVNVLPISGQDRAIAIPTSGGYLVALADGAGGTGNGAVAAERLIEFVSGLTEKAASTDWFDALCTFDDELSARPLSGQTTGIVAFVTSRHIIGASIGDSSAWLISLSGQMTDLTARQRRKPLLGSGEALPVQFEAERLGNRVLLGSDGLFKYAPLDRICTLAKRGTVAEAANALANCVRLPSGTFHDDVAVAIVSE
ncbi:MAG: protein phosphatase 2C domain-containing protein [Steroidobacteraceae bacterium]